METPESRAAGSRPSSEARTHAARLVNYVHENESLAPVQALADLIVEAIDGGDLARSFELAQQVQSAIGHMLATSGFDASDEPTAHGCVLEHGVDMASHVIYAIEEGAERVGRSVT